MRGHGPAHAKARVPAGHRRAGPATGRTSRHGDQTRRPDEPWSCARYGFVRWLAVRFFARARAVGVDLVARAVQADRFNAHGQDLLVLKLGKHALDDPGLAPAAQAHVDRVLGTEVPGQAAPLAAVLEHVQKRVEQRQVVHPYVATLARQTSFDPLVLLTGKFHPPILPQPMARSSSVNRP